MASLLNSVQKIWACTEIVWAGCMTCGQVKKKHISFLSVCLNFRCLSLLCSLVNEIWKYLLCILVVSVSKVFKCEMKNTMLSETTEEISVLESCISLFYQTWTFESNIGTEVDILNEYLMRIVSMGEHMNS